VTPAPSEKKSQNGEDALFAPSQNPVPLPAREGLGVRFFARARDSRQGKIAGPHLDQVAPMRIATSHSVHAIIFDS